MNKLYLVIVVLCTSIHCMNLTMNETSESYTLKRDRIRALILQRTEEKEQQEFNKQENFLHSFGQESINRTGELFCNLSLVSKQKVVSQLSYNQNLLVWFGAQGLDIPLLTILCNGNENVAHIYRNEPINKVLKAYANAKEMMKKVSINGLSLPHYMVLQDSEINIFANAWWNKRIHHSDLSPFMKAIKKLKKIDPECIEDINAITDSAQTCPSLQEAALLFWNAPAPINVMIKSFLGGTGIGFVGSLFSIDQSAFESLIATSMMGLPVPLAFGFWEKCKNFHINFKNSISSQPTITEALKKHVSHE